MFYSRYVNRFTRNGQTYYVHFAVQQMLGSRKQAGESLLHSAFVSSVEIYEQNKGAAPETVSVWESPVLTAGATPHDSTISQWLEAGKQEASQVIDPQTGEPLVIYHGTNDSGYFENAQGQTQYATDNPRYLIQPQGLNLGTRAVRHRQGQNPTRPTRDKRSPRRCAHWGLCGSRTLG